MPPPDDIGVGELSRRLAEVFARIEGLAQRIEGGMFVRTELYNAHRENDHRTIKALESQLSELEKDKAERDALTPIESRVQQLEEDRKWLIRLVLTFVIMGVLGSIFVITGGKP